MMKKILLYIICAFYYLTGYSQSYVRLISQIDSLLFCGDTIGASIKVQDNLEYYKKACGVQSELYSHALSDKTYFLHKIGDYETSVICAKNVCDIKLNCLGPNSFEYAIACIELSTCLWDSGEIEEAIETQLRAYSIFTSNSFTQKIEFGEILNNLIVYYGEIEEYEECLNYCHELYDFYQATLLPTSPSKYASELLNNLSGYYKALGLEDEELSIYKECLLLESEDSDNYTIVLFEYFKTLKDYGHYEEAVAIGKKALLSWSEKNNTVEIQYVCGLISNYLAECCYIVGRYFESISYSKKAIGYLEKPDNENIDLYIATLNEEAAAYSILGDYASAIKYQEEALAISQQYWGANNIKNARTISNLACYYTDCGNIRKSVTLGEEAYKILKMADELDNQEYSLYLGNLASVYGDIGDYEKAVEIINFVKEKYEKNCIYNEEYVAVLNNFATFSSHIENAPISELIEIENRCIEILDSIANDSHPFYSLSISNLASLYNQKNDYKEALKYIEKAITNIEKSKGKCHPDKIMALYNKAFSYSSLQMQDSALYTLLEAKEIQKGNKIKYNALHILIDDAIVTTYKKLGDYDSMIKNAIIASNNYIELMKRDFLYLSSYERERYWNKYGDWFYEVLPSLLRNNKSEEFAKIVYNTLLFSKGILLSSEKEIERAIMETDSSLYSEWMKIKNNGKTALNSIQSLPEDDIKERGIINRVLQTNAISNLFSASFEDVVASLEKNDIAIEFVESKTDSITTYFALLLKKDYSAPIAIPIINNEDLLTFYNWNKDNCDSLQALIWMPINKYLEDVRNIYFSPTGLLCNLPIETLPSIKSNGYMNEDYNMYRVSSTRVLTNKPLGLRKNKKAILFGGLNYDSAEITDTDSESSKERFFDASERGSFSYLPSSQKEIEDVNAILKDDYDCSIYSGHNGTEETFKSMSKDINILHLATHGFYWPLSSTNKKDYGFLTSVKNRETKESVALKRSGLLLAGANRALQNEDISDNIEDGIITSEEISKVDFEDLNLVVISACQSGLGDIESDGIYGLQRGFKKSGARSILMSLWNVNDFATSTLMTQFYYNLAKGVNKQESLSNAQKYVREYSDDSGNHPFEDPYYWAAWILLDGLD